MSYAVRRRFAASLAAVVALVALIGSVVVAAPALADPFTAVLDLGKSVDKTSVAPGQTFTYTWGGVPSSAITNTQIRDSLRFTADLNLSANQSMVLHYGTNRLTN